MVLLTSSCIRCSELLAVRQAARGKLYGAGGVRQYMALAVNHSSTWQTTVRGAWRQTSGLGGESGDSALRRGLGDSVRRPRVRDGAWRRFDQRRREQGAGWFEAGQRKAPGYERGRAQGSGW
eukprot:1489634-Pleurochrysis_carterae.AAC.2